MHRGLLACCALVTLTLAAGDAQTTKAAGPDGSDSKVTITSAEIEATEADLGRMIGETSNHSIVIDNGGSALGRSMWRGMVHTAPDTAPPDQARNAFIGGGTSVDDLLRPAIRPVNPDIDYVALLYGHLATIDPGGTVEHVAFYEDDNGCETDVLTRRSKNGEVRPYFVDTTGWQDKMFGEMNEKPERHCTR